MHFCSPLACGSWPRFNHGAFVMFASVLFVHFRSHMVLGFWSWLDQVISFVPSLVLFQSCFVNFRSHMVRGSWSCFDHVISFVPLLVLLLQSRLFCLVCARFRIFHFRTFFLFRTLVFAHLLLHACFRTPVRSPGRPSARSYAFARLFRTFVRCLHG